MKTNRKPMLAALMNPKKDECMDTITYPGVASRKIDGIRCWMDGGTPLTRSLKPIPNRHITRLMSDARLAGLDGELMIGDGSSFQKVTSGIMTPGGEPDFSFHVFDDFTNPLDTYARRIHSYRVRVMHLAAEMPWLKPVPTRLVHSKAELLAFCDECLADGYEGAMFRHSTSPYKFGRATFKEHFLTKIKPLEDQEATVIGFEEQESNTNEAHTNELGRTARSSHKAGKIGKGTLGALVVTNREFGQFNVGTGFDDSLRQQIWNDRTGHIGKTLTFRFQRIGTKDKPRCPAFKGFRHAADIS